MGPAGRVSQQHPEWEERNQAGMYKPGVCKTPDVILLHLQSVSMSLESHFGLSVSSCGSWRKPREEQDQKFRKHDILEKAEGPG